MTNIYPCAVHHVSDSFQDHVDRGSVNPGTDYTAASGSDVWAIAAGVVKVADGNPDGSGGRTIVIFHDDGSSSDYLHLNAVSVSVGQRVQQGQRIGFSGGSGYDSNTYYEDHLHISFRPHNQIAWLGNAGNTDFDALMRSQTTSAGSGGTPLTPTPQEEEMPLVYVQSNTPKTDTFAWIVVAGGGLPKARQFTPANNRAEWSQFCDLYNTAAAKRGLKPISKDLSDAQPVNDQEYRKVLALWS